MFQPKRFTLLLLAGFVVSLASGLTGSTNQAVGQLVRFETNVGDIDVQLHPNDAPITVANFLSYMNAAAGSNYDGSFIHRSIPGFVVQGGGFYTSVDNAVPVPVPAMASIVNEFGISNTRGTVAMAKLGGDPDSATNQWFFNLADNSENLDNQNGGFTVFGTVVSGLNIVDEIASLPIANFQGTFSDIPVILGPDQNIEDFVEVNTIVVVPVVLGDVNRDGSVTFADIPSFITLLRGGGYQSEADCDQSASVDFGDIPAFIAILIAQ